MQWRPEGLAFAESREHAHFCAAQAPFAAGFLAHGLGNAFVVADALNLTRSQVVEHLFVFVDIDAIVATSYRSTSKSPSRKYSGYMRSAVSSGRVCQF